MPRNPDAVELSHLEEVQAHAGYALIAERIRLELLKQIGTTEKPGTLELSDPASAVEIFGFVRGLRCALRIPAILALEIRARLKEGGQL